jgi:hypothetical protein
VHRIPRLLLAVFAVAIGAWPVRIAAATAPAKGAAKTAQPQASRRVLPTIADDYPKALARARAAKLPIFIEAWAPW